MWCDSVYCTAFHGKILRWQVKIQREISTLKFYKPLYTNHLSSNWNFLWILDYIRYVDNVNDDEWLWFDTCKVDTCWFIECHCVLNHIDCKAVNIMWFPLHFLFIESIIIISWSLNVVISPMNSVIHKHNVKIELNLHGNISYI